ncbi:MAG: flavodoxin domain-containing protein, partial [Halanaerobiales bacterium]
KHINKIATDRIKQNKNGRYSMKTLIAYGTKHGAVKKCAEKLADQLNGEVVVVNLKKTQDPDLNRYEQIVIGSSVYMGRIRKEVSKFCDRYLDVLMEKEIALFTCCMTEGEEAVDQLKRNYPEELVEKSTTIGIFGGEFNFEKMNFLEKMVVKKVADVEETQSNILEKNIGSFAKAIND